MKAQHRFSIMNVQRGITRMLVLAALVVGSSSAGAPATAVHAAGEVSGSVTITDHGSYSRVSQVASSVSQLSCAETITVHQDGSATETIAFSYHAVIDQTSDGYETKHTDDITGSGTVQYNPELYVQIIPDGTYRLGFAKADPGIVAQETVTAEQTGQQPTITRSTPTVSCEYDGNLLAGRLGGDEVLEGTVTEYGHWNYFNDDDYGPSILTWTITDPAARSSGGGSSPGGPIPAPKIHSYGSVAIDDRGSYSATSSGQTRTSQLSCAETITVHQDGSATETIAFSYHAVIDQTSDGYEIKHTDDITGSGTVQYDPELYVQIIPDGTYRLGFAKADPGIVAQETVTAEQTGQQPTITRSTPTVSCEYDGNLLAGRLGGGGTLKGTVTKDGHWNYFNSDDYGPSTLTWTITDPALRLTGGVSVDVSVTDTPTEITTPNPTTTRLVGGVSTDVSVTDTPTTTRITGQVSGGGSVTDTPTRTPLPGHVSGGGSVTNTPTATATPTRTPTSTATASPTPTNGQPCPTPGTPAVAAYAHAAAATTLERGPQCPSRRQGLLIVGLGDSVASGEGSPDRTIAQGGAQWESTQCHRSANSFPALAARQVQLANPGIPVTFEGLACSGATIDRGLLGPYEGIDPPAGLVQSFRIPGIGPVRIFLGNPCQGSAAARCLAPQVEELRRINAQRPVDAVLLSVGANDSGLTQLLWQCSLNTTHELDFGSFKTNSLRFPCQRLNLTVPATTPKGNVVPQLLPADEAIPIRLKILSGQYDALAGALVAAGIPADRVYLTEYYDPTQSAPGAYCTQFPPLRIDEADARWFSRMISQLNATAKAAADHNHWHYVLGVAGAFATHGYCAASRWIVTFAQSSSEQGDIFGTMHPNVAGQACIAERVLQTLPAAMTRGVRSTACTAGPPRVPEGVDTRLVVQFQQEGPGGAGTIATISTVVTNATPPGVTKQQGMAAVEGLLDRLRRGAPPLGSTERWPARTAAAMQIWARLVKNNLDRIQRFAGPFECQGQGVHALQSLASYDGGSLRIDQECKAGWIYGQ